MLRMKNEKNKISAQVMVLIMLLFMVIIYSTMMIMTFLNNENVDSIVVVGYFFIVILFILNILNAVKNAKKNVGKKIKYDINYGFFMILSFFLIFLYIFLTLLVKNISYRISGVETLATVYDVKKKISYKTEYDDGIEYEKKIEECNVYIEYYANNNKYNTELDIKTCKYKINDKIKIYYKKNNPKDFSSKSIIMLLLVNVFIFFAFGCFIYNTVKNKIVIKKNLKFRKDKKK